MGLRNEAFFFILKSKGGAPKKQTRAALAKASGPGRAHKEH
ncbi:MAG: hypothetical protein PVF37_22605 [Desulfobacterales bacterium]|jgi:hypothetical protein